MIAPLLVALVSLSAGAHMAPSIDDPVSLARKAAGYRGDDASVHPPRLLVQMYQAALYPGCESYSGCSNLMSAAIHRWSWTAIREDSLVPVDQCRLDLLEWASEEGSEILDYMDDYPSNGIVGPFEELVEGALRITAGPNTDSCSVLVDVEWSWKQWLEGRHLRGEWTWFPEQS